ncbi:unnamed protein product [Spirodela intermedia]|uniref:DUF7032 domain-containing protein n=1 Tax=Spirodela intermedia TaxID=51605 RepID=A0A7I8IET6_SPIIN|nr:unnamed protein product [Spirodela intermedia]CAA6656307.1 unnamed protein product [Spirodela intermedia]
MVEEPEDPVGRATACRGDDAAHALSAECRLGVARRLLPAALEKARAANGFAGRWNAIISKLERVPPCFSDLSSHPCFAKNALCGEQLQSACQILEEVIALAGRCGGEAAPPVGKLRMQSDLDAVAGKLELILRDCGLLIKTGVLGEATLSCPPCVRSGEESPAATSSPSNLRQLLARIQIGDAEAKDRAFDGLLEMMREDRGNVVAALGRSNISALVQLLTAPSPKLREKAASVVCSLAESGSCDSTLVSEGALPPLIKLAESGSFAGREKAAISLESLSTSASTARAIVGHGGLPAAAGALKNLSAVPEVLQDLADEGAIRLAVDLLDDCGVEPSTKKHAAECLQNLTAGGENLRRAVVSEGGEPAIVALKNLAGSIAMSELLSMGLLPRLTHALKAGSLEARRAAASAICRISSCPEARKSAGRCGCLPLLISMLETKDSCSRETAAQALSNLMSCTQNAREVKKDSRSVPNLVQLLDPSPHNTAKKYAVPCLLLLSASKRSRKMMISYGAIGYLKKLSEEDAPGSKSLLQRLERGGWGASSSRNSPFWQNSEFLTAVTTPRQVPPLLCSEGNL